MSIRQEIKAGLAVLFERHHMLFKRMYSPDDLDADINDVVDFMPRDKLAWALMQVNNSINAQKEKEKEMSLEDKIKEWYPISEKLKELKKQEMSLRVEICEEMINGVAGKPLTVKAKETLMFGNMKVDANAKTSLKIDKEVYDDIEEDLSPEALLCIKTSMTVVKAKIDVLDDDDNLFDAVYETPSTPTLSVKHFGE